MAAVLLAIGIVPGGRFRAWLTAALIAAAATVLALVTSWSVRAIEVDRSAEVAAAEAAGAQAAQEKFRGRAARVRFAEDTAADRVDVAGVTVAEEEGACERAIAAELGKIPACRRGGPKDRSGKRRGEAAPDDSAPEDTGPEESGTQSAGADGQAATETPVRRLPEAQLQVADRFDRINRGLAWSLLSLAVDSSSGVSTRPIVCSPIVPPGSNAVATAARRRGAHSTSSGRGPWHLTPQLRTGSRGSPPPRTSAGCALPAQTNPPDLDWPCRPNWFFIRPGACTSPPARPSSPTRRSASGSGAWQRTSIVAQSGSSLVAAA